MLFNLIHLPYWILLGLGVVLYLMVILSGGGDDDADLDGDVDLNGDAGIDVDSDFDLGQILGWFGFGKAPLILLLATDLSLWGVWGWFSNMVFIGVTGQIPGSFWTGLILALSLVMALVLGGLISQPIGKALAAFGEDASGDRLVGCVGTVSSALVPRVAEGRIGQVNVIDPARNLVNANAQIPQWARAVPKLGDKVLVIDRTGSTYLVILKDSPDQEQWLNPSRQN
ncbi:DUF1449 domain-containing protein [Leptolyngbya sp. 'hensonii']|nr:DUF1449 domain-containing protein [Leptolyngbya sp. 'hensonii']